MNTIRTHTATDSHGVTILPGDHVMVTSWGSPVRLTDTGRVATVHGFTPRGNVILAPNGVHDWDPIARGRAVPGTYLTVVRRDGAPGFEGNRDLYPTD